MTVIENQLKNIDHSIILDIKPFHNYYSSKLGIERCHNELKSDGAHGC